MKVYTIEFGKMTPDYELDRQCKNEYTCITELDTKWLVMGLLEQVANEDYATVSYIEVYTGELDANAEDIVNMQENQCIMGESPKDTLMLELQVRGGN